MAEAAAIVLSDETYVGATLELAGTSALSQSRVAELLTAELNRPVFFEEVSLVDWVEENSSLSVYERDTLLAMFGYYANYGLVGNSAVLGMILDRKPQDLAGFIQSQ